MPEAISLRTFLPLPFDNGPPLWLMGPSAAEAGVAVHLATGVEPAVTALQGVLAGVCDAADRLVTPIELIVVVEPGATIPHGQVPTADVIAGFAEAATRIPSAPVPGFEALEAMARRQERLWPLLFCRKSRSLFFARSPRNGAILTRATEPPPGQESQVALLLADGGPDDSETLYYGPGESERVQALDRVILAQPDVVQRARRMLTEDALLAHEAGAARWACQCEHCRTPDQTTGAYRASLDRLAIVHAADVPLVIRPLGEWRLREAQQILGGRDPLDALAPGSVDSTEFEKWRRARAHDWAAAGPVRAFTGETDGRELLEAVRDKLGLMLGVLEQLDAAWTALDRPHLNWNDETVRVAWCAPAAGSPTSAGAHPILRKVGWHPMSSIETFDPQPQPYPPFGDPTLLPPETVDAARYWNEERKAQVFVKRNKGPADLAVLIENLGVAWELFRPGDSIHVEGKGWKAILTPLAERDPNDGEGLPFRGRYSGAADQLKVGEEYPDCLVRWYPRFGQAVDLHAFGVMLLDSLLSTDERESARFRVALANERSEITQSAASLPIEQRESFIRYWVGEQAESDAPAAVWTRRNGLWPRVLRQTTTLEGFPATPWSIVLGYALRLVTYIPGYSFCPDRTAAAPRVEGLLEPLVELHGLLALLDDQLYVRSAPEAALREAFSKED